MSFRAAFVHDHVFPKHANHYYESSGFDNVFMQRYLGLFGSLRIIAREFDMAGLYNKNSKVIEYSGIDYCTFKKTRDLFTINGYKRLKQNILSCEYIVIRVPSVFGILASYICEKYKKPYIVEVVGCPRDALSNKGILWKIPALIYGYLTKLVVRRAKYVVYVTEKFLEDKYPTSGLYISCSNVTLENYGSVNIEKRLGKIRQYNTYKTIVIGTCADLSAWYKAQEDVMRSILILKNKGYKIEYQLVGGGDNSRLKKISENLGVSDMIEFCGELSHDDVFAWLDTLDIYVHPSKTEGLCRAIIEAMSRACPIIASDAGGIHEQIDDKYVFPKGDVNAICKLIECFTKETMKIQAEKNYKNAEKYKADVLYNKRKKFFETFKKNNSRIINEEELV